MKVKRIRMNFWSRKTLVENIRATLVLSLWPEMKARPLWTRRGFFPLRTGLREVALILKQKLVDFCDSVFIFVILKNSDRIKCLGHVNSLVKIFFSFLRSLILFIKLFIRFHVSVYLDDDCPHVTKTDLQMSIPTFCNFVPISIHNN